MKNFSLNPLSIAFIVAISVSPSHAQTYSINTSAVNTIVRGVGNRQYIYCQENDSCGYFVRTSLLQNQQCDGIRMIGVVVTDFTYWNDTLYFVGRKKNNTGVYGWVKIRPNGYFYPFTVRSIGELRDRFYNLKRIQVFRSGGDLHALVVGDYTPHGSTERSCLIDIVNNTSCQYAYTTDEVIDDVCLTENYVSVVARKGGGNLACPLYMRMLSRAAFSLNDSMYNHYYPWSKTTAVGRTFITAGGGDNVFTVFRDANMYRCVNVFQLAATGYSVLRYQQNPPYAADIRDVSYRPSDSTLAVLYRGVSDTALAIYVCGDSLDISSQDFYVPANDTTGSIVYSSVSRNTNSSFTVVGQLNGRPYVWLTSLSCSESRNEILPGDNSQTSVFLWSPTRASAMLFIEPGLTLTKRLCPQTRCRRDSVDKEDKE